ncbi:MAG: LysM peptidoglycan-binding domain-containing protein [Actinomycetota bacterium]|nr:LysM peptidoglycan-binding domain-containing protein [Actinomycetota bacterium]
MPPNFRRRQTMAAGLSVVALLVLWFALRAALGGSGGGPLTTTGLPGGPTAPVAAHSWVVQPGDTLWSIAGRLEPGRDIRPLVDRLVVSSGHRPLQVGQRLMLP